jgi:hypothetical protein
MSTISDIRHRHLLFQYRRQLFRTENCHYDIGSVPILTSESIPKSDIYTVYIKIYHQLNMNSCSAPCYYRWVLYLSAMVLLHVTGICWIKLYSDIRYNVGLCSLNPISEIPISVSVRYRWSRIPDYVSAHLLAIGSNLFVSTHFCRTDGCNLPYRGCKERYQFSNANCDGALPPPGRGQHFKLTAARRRWNMIQKSLLIKKICVKEGRKFAMYKINWVFTQLFVKSSSPAGKD